MSDSSTQLYSEQHSQYAQESFSSQSSWVQDLQSAALAQLNENGLPNTSHEEWRYTDTKYLAKSPKKVNLISSSNTSDLTDAVDFIGKDNIQIVFADGLLHTDLSTLDLPKGLTITSMADELSSGSESVKPYLNTLTSQYEEGWSVLNTSFLQQGLFIKVDSNVEVEKTLEILHIRLNEASHIEQYRHIYVAEESAKLNVIERFRSFGNDDAVNNTVTELYCADSSLVQRTILQENADKATQFHHTYVRQGATCNFNNYTISLSGRLMRNEFYGQLLGSGSDCKMYGLYAPNGRQHIDNCTQIEHMVPECTSDELFKGVLDDYGRSVFRGRIYVAQDAQQTDAYQNNRNLILSRNAEADTKPQLEIYANDVKCSHGATIGQLEDESLFYLRSRGVPADEARRMLIYAFVGEVIDAIEDETLKAYIDDALHKQLSKGSMFQK